MAAKERNIPSPRPMLETGAYWQAASQNRLLIKHCQDCGDYHFYPRILCPFCFSDRTEWRDASGRGRIYSFSILRRAPVPYAMAYVTLEEGPSMMTNIVECELDAIRIDQPVIVVFKPSDGGQLVPMFKPA